MPTSPRPASFGLGCISQSTSSIRRKPTRNSPRFCRRPSAAFKVWRDTPTMLARCD